jgi:hypothetical protein
MASSTGYLGETSMSFFDRLRSIISFGRPLAITLNLAERDGGYFFVSSPQLKGFNLLLEPGNYHDFRTFIDAVDEPLTEYMNIYQHARHAHREKLRIRSTKMEEDGALVAHMCFQ